MQRLNKDFRCYSHSFLAKHSKNKVIVMTTHNKVTDLFYLSVLVRKIILHEVKLSSLHHYEIHNDIMHNPTSWFIWLVKYLMHHEFLLGCIWINCLSRIIYQVSYTMFYFSIWYYVFSFLDVIHTLSFCLRQWFYQPVQAYIFTVFIVAIPGGQYVN